MAKGENGREWEGDVGQFGRWLGKPPAEYRIGVKSPAFVYFFTSTAVYFPWFVSTRRDFCMKDMSILKIPKSIYKAPNVLQIQPSYNKMV